MMHHVLNKKNMAHDILIRFILYASTKLPSIAARFFSSPSVDIPYTLTCLFWFVFLLYIAHCIKMLFAGEYKED
ncbi:MAG: hypothetical protein E7L17_11245 [Clostridium sp.]|uniref:hypothetical protein n=1 Tax=Clostridium sp. TaxID=1506 RepID=UPI002910545D|nr:hypothetical protein [Clostridium sp.]MDU7338677.1 hypothetical protein [Clostridium sp.]